MAETRSSGRGTSRRENVPVAETGGTTNGFSTLSWNIPTRGRVTSLVIDVNKSPTGQV